jgi:hypothetical protein
MVVTVNQEVLPGSIITVQYPAPTVSAVARIPQPSVEVAASTDSEYEKYTWLLYASGCCCMCCFAPLGMLLWLVASALYFCKPAQERAQMPRTRNPAFVAAITALACLVLGLLMIPLALVAVEESGGSIHFGPHDNPFHHGHHGHHPVPPPPGHFLRASHEPPKPCQFMKRFFQSVKSKIQDHQQAPSFSEPKRPAMPGVPMPEMAPLPEGVQKTNIWSKPNWIKEEVVKTPEAEPVNVDKLFFN